MIQRVVMDLPLAPPYEAHTATVVAHVDSVEGVVMSMDLTIDGSLKEIISETVLDLAELDARNEVNIEPLVLEKGLYTV